MGQMIFVAGESAERSLIMRELTNAEVLADGLKNFDLQEDFIREGVADYIACPSVEPCNYDGLDNSCCTPCKVNWLLSRWED